MQDPTIWTHLPKATHLSFQAPPLCISKKLHFTKKKQKNNNNKMRFLYIKKYNRYEYDVITTLQKKTWMWEVESISKP